MKTLKEVENALHSIEVAIKVHYDAVMNESKQKSNNKGFSATDFKNNDLFNHLVSARNSLYFIKGRLSQL